MPDTKISALPAASAVDAADELAVNDAGTSKKITAAQLKTFAGGLLIAGASGAVSADPAPSTTNHILTAAPGDITGTGLVTQMTSQSLGVGWWRAIYHILWQSNVLTTGINFVLDFSGTASPFVATRTGTASVATASDGIAKQLQAAAIGSVPTRWTARADAQALGPSAGVDVINAEQYDRIEAIFLVTAAGNLLLQAAAEIAATVVRVRPGTHAELTRLS